MIPVENIETEYGTIAISRNPVTGTLIYKVGSRQQGAMDKSGVSLAYYIHALYGLLVQAKARNVLMIGGGCCNLGSMLARAQCRITIVDVSPQSFAVARRHFGLAEAAICHVAEGEQFLRGDAGTYDAIVLDAFHGDDIPPHLQSPAFFALARQRLAVGGIMLMNVLVRNDSDTAAQRIAKSMRNVWPDVRMLDAPGVTDRNAIVMAGAAARLREPELLVRPVTNPHVIEMELGRLKFRTTKKARWRFWE